MKILPTIAKLVIFDCDGVLVDSESICAQVMCEVLQGLGSTCTVEDVDRSFRGRSLSDCMERLETHWQISLPPTFLATLNERTFAALEAELRPICNVVGAIERIQAAGLPICVASSGSHQKINHSLGLTNLIHHFEGNLFSASEVRAGKPAPDIFLHAAKRMGVPSSQCVVVEDSLPGAEGALAAGCRVLAYSSQERRDHNAHFRALKNMGALPFTDMRELPRLLSLG